MFSQKIFWSLYDNEYNYEFAVKFGRKTKLEHELISYCERNYSIYFLVQGNELLECNDVIYKINSGDIIFIKQKTQLEKECLSENINFIELNFNIGNKRGILEKKILDVISNLKAPISIMRIDSNRYISLVKKIETFMNIPEEKKEIYSLQLFLDVVLEITSINTVNKYKNDLTGEITKTEKTIQEVTAYIHYNFSKKITTETLSREFDMSRPYLCQKFKEYSGSTIGEYLSEIRMTYALELLSSTHEKIISIAYLVGYESVSQFNKTFKKKYLITPSQFRDRGMMISAT